MKAFFFVLIAIGCILFALVLVDRLVYGVVTKINGAASPSAAVLTVLYWVGESPEPPEDAEVVATDSSAN